MDRRRFAKYAAAGVAVVGSGLVGYEISKGQTPLVPLSLSTNTITETRTLQVAVGRHLSVSL